MTGDTLLTVEDLHASYDVSKVLHGVSLDVEEGGVTGLVGRNGAGKTTTLRSILGHTTITNGTVVFDGTEITDHNPVETVTDGIGFVPEGRRVFADLTVEENLLVGETGRTDESSAWDSQEVFDLFDNLAESRDRHASSLSGGEQQMLAIGRVLVQGVDLLLLDEPTEGLAPQIVEQVEGLVTRLNEEGITVLLVEQNLEVAMNVCDDLYILDDGEVVYSGTPADLNDNEEIIDRYLGVSELSH